MTQIGHFTTILVLNNMIIVKRSHLKYLCIVKNIFAKKDPLLCLKLLIKKILCNQKLRANIHIIKLNNM